MQSDAAGFSELDRVIGQIHHNLAKPPAVAPGEGGHGWVDFIGQRQVLAGGLRT